MLEEWAETRRVASPPPVCGSEEALPVSGPATDPGSGRRVSRRRSGSRRNRGRSRREATAAVPSRASPAAGGATGAAGRLAAGDDFSTGRPVDDLLDTMRLLRRFRVGRGAPTAAVGACSNGLRRRSARFVVVTARRGGRRGHVRSATVQDASRVYPLPDVNPWRPAHARPGAAGTVPARHACHPHPEEDDMLWLLLLILLIIAVGGGVWISKFLFFILVVALIVAIFAAVAGRIEAAAACPGGIDASRTACRLVVAGTGTEGSLVATTQRRTVWLSGAMLGVLAIGWLSGSAAATKLGPAPTASTAGGSRSASVRTAARELAKLRVSREAPRTGPPRGAFGPPWADVDRNGCDTRDDILRRDLIQVTLEPGSRCVVASGTLLDPYTGRQLAFVRRSPARRVRSTTSSPSATRGAVERLAGRPDAGCTSRTTPSCCSPSTARSSQPRPAATRPGGCRRTEATTAGTPRSRSRSRPGTRSRSRGRRRRRCRRHCAAAWRRRKSGEIGACCLNYDAPGTPDSWRREGAIPLGPAPRT